MKISEMIKNLVEFVAEYGDLECFFATDDEGNNYGKVMFAPTRMHTTIDGEIVTHEDIVEYEYEDGEYEPICIVN